jgi:hypothetical protein
MEMPLELLVKPSLLKYLDCDEVMDSSEIVKILSERISNFDELLGKVLINNQEKSEDKIITIIYKGKGVTPYVLPDEMISIWKGEKQ